MRARLTVLALVTALLAATTGFAACPTSTYFYGGFNPSTPIALPVAANDTTFAVQPCESMHGRYQVNAGLLLALTSGCSVYSSFAGITGLETVIEDDFTVTGPPAGTPVAFDAVLALDGYAFDSGPPGGGGGGRIRGLVFESAANQVALQTGTGSTSSVEVHQPITLHVNAVAGTPVRLRFAVRGESIDGTARMEGIFRFEGLPPGAAIESCRGYRSNAVVPGRTSTWGALKTRYR